MKDKPKICTNCEYYRRKFCTKYQVAVWATQRCVEIGQNEPQELSATEQIE